MANWEPLDSGIANRKMFLLDAGTNNIFHISCGPALSKGRYRWQFHKHAGAETFSRLSIAKDRRQAGYETIHHDVLMT